jgi:membrane dipeptidase
MKRFLPMTAALALAVSLPAPAAPEPAAEDGIAPRAAARLHRRAIVVDTHLDVPYTLDGKWADIGVRGATPHYDIPRAREGGLTAGFFAIYVPARFAESGGAARKALELIDMVHRLAVDHPRDLVLAESAAGIRRAKKEGRMALLMGIEGGHAIEDSLGALRVFHRLGVRYMTLTHTNTNNWADSSGAFYLPDFDPAAYRRHDGLSDFGRIVVREMNRLGMLVDVSHVSDETLDDVLEASRAPVFASHSSCRALSDIPRNLTDDQIRRIAARGGVVMINIGSYFLDPVAVEKGKAGVAALLPDYERLKREHAGDPVRLWDEIHKLLDTVPRHRTVWTKAVDHIERVIRVAGPDAVGLGSDFDGIEDPPEGLDDVSFLPRLTGELLRRGHSEETVLKFLGGNFLRLLERAEAVARGLRAEPPATATLPATAPPPASR